MTTNASPTTLTDFLLARIAEDGAVARAAWADSGWVVWGDKITSPRDVIARGVEGRTGAHIVRYSPARVLAECEAKSRIVEVAMPGESDDPHTERGRILRILAAVYADHPDYDERWKP